MVARSLPEPLTHMTETSRPAWSVAITLAEVFPPPKFDTARSAPSRRDAKTSRSSSSAAAGGSRGHRSSARSIVCSVETLIVGIPRS